MKRNQYIVVAGYLLCSILLAGLARAEASEPVGQELAVVPNSSSSNKVNIRIKPLETLAGLPTASVSFLVDPRLSLGIEGMVMTSDATIKTAIKNQNASSDIDYFDLSASSFGGRFDFAFGQSIMASTWYTSGSVHSLKVNVKDNRRFGGEGSADIVLAKAVFGYQWMWDHFNINLAGGLGVPLVEKYKINVDSYTFTEDDIKKTATAPALEFGLGFAF